VGPVAVTSGLIYSGLSRHMDSAIINPNSPAPEQLAAQVCNTSHVLHTMLHAYRYGMWVMMHVCALPALLQLSAAESATTGCCSAVLLAVHSAALHVQELQRLLRSDYLLPRVLPCPGCV
jgi:hypothetical protein